MRILDDVARFMRGVCGTLYPNLSHQKLDSMCTDVSTFNIVKFRSLSHVEVAQIAVHATHHILSLSAALRSLTDHYNKQSNELIDAQRKIIKLQEELLASKTVQLESVQATVKNSVESVGDVVKAEIVSYSDAVKSSAAAKPTAEELRTAVRDVVVEEDRSRSLMIFGLPEQEEELVEERVSDMFLSELGENNNKLINVSKMLI